MTRDFDNPYRQPLHGNLVMKTPGSAADIERAAAFNGVIHGPGVAPMSYNLFMHHPNIEPRDIFFVEDEDTRQVVSSLCLIPWLWNIDGVELPAGEMGIVGTLEGYRRQGLIRAQVAAFKRRLAERGCLLSHIQGIPYYYRQFGYEYALPLEGGLQLEWRRVPAEPAPPFTFRLAGLADIPALMRLYEEAAAELDVHAVRSEAIWRYLLTRTDGTEMEAETWIVEDPGGEAAGYFRLPAHHFGAELAINEASRLPFEAALAVLQHVKALAAERGEPGLRLNLPALCSLAQLARSLGARDPGTYAWQIHIPDFTALLRALQPALNRRLAGSPFSHSTVDLRLSLYREGLLLRIHEGEVVEVQSSGAIEEADAGFPPRAFLQFVLGHRSLEELSAAYPDVSVTPVWRLLVETLFPQLEAFLYNTY